MMRPFAFPGILCGVAVLSMSGAAFGADLTNTITGSTTELWSDGTQWGGTVPGFWSELATGDSNDNAWVLFRGSNNQTPTLNIAGSNWTLKTLFISEQQSPAANVDGNFISRQGATDVDGSLTLEQINYYEGNRELDFQQGVRIFDKADGNALVISNASTLDFWAPVTGSEGLMVGGSNSTLYVRDFRISFGASAANGLTFDSSASGGKYFLFNLSETNADVVSAIPNLNYIGTVDPSMFFARSLGTNSATVSISNINLSANRTVFRVGGQSAADGAAVVTVNLEGRLEFTNTTVAADRTLDVGSVHNGRVNVNGGILIDQGVDSTVRTLVLSGNGSVGMNSDVQAISGFGLMETFTNRVRLDGDRNLEVTLDQQGRFGQAQQVDLRGGAVLRLNYDAFASGYPGVQLTNLAGVTSIDSRNWFIDFGAVQSGFYDPYDTNQPFLVRALTGVGGNLSNAVYSGGTPNMIFETNAVIIEGALNAPTTADIGDNVVYLGIRDAGGTNNNLGAAGSIYKGAALGASTYIGESRLYDTNGGVNAYLSGYYGSLGAAAGQDLEVMVLGSTYVSPNSYTERAQFNADTGVANFRGPGSLRFETTDTGIGAGLSAWGGSVTQINRIGYAEAETNLFGFHTQNSDILVLGAQAIPTGAMMFADNGRVQLEHGEAIGGEGPSGNVNATLQIGSNATLILDNNDQITRGRLVTDPGAFVFVSSGTDRLTAIAGITNSWSLSPDSLLILDDNGNNTTRDVADLMYELFLRSMNVVISSNFQSYTVRAASGGLTGGDWEIGDGRRITTPSDDNAGITNISAGAARFGIRLMDAATNMMVSAAASRTLTLGVNVTATNTWGNANLTIGDTNDFTTTRFKTGVGYRSTVAQSGTVVLNGPTGVFDSATLVAGNATFSNTLLLAGNLTVTNNRSLTVQGVSNVIGVANVDGTLNFQTVAPNTVMGVLNHNSGTTTFDSRTNVIGSINGASGAINLRGFENMVTGNVTLAGGADFTIGNTNIARTTILGDIVVNEGLENDSDVNFSRGNIEVFGNVLWNRITNMNSAGGFLGESVLTLYAETNIIHGSVYIGPTNPIDGVLGGSGRIVVGDNPWDFTQIDGSLVIDAPRQPSNNPQQLNRGDLVVSNDIIINVSRINYEDVNNTNQYNYGGSRFQIDVDYDTNRSDGVGFYDRLRDGTLALGPNGIEVRDFASLYMLVPTTNDVFTIGQKITIDQQDAHYWYVDGRTIEVVARTNLIGGVHYGQYPPKVDLTNIWMREGSFLRVDEAIAGGAGATNLPVVRLGIIVDGATTNGRAFLSDGSSTANDAFDLLDVRSGSPGVAKILQIGTTNGRWNGQTQAYTLDDIAFTNVLFGTVSSDVTLDVFNGNLQMTNGAAILGAAQVSRDGSIFDILPGTTGYVNEVRMLAGTFSNRGDQMALDNVNVLGGQAVLGGSASYTTNLNLFGGTAIVQQASLGRVTFDGGSLRADADYVLNAGQGVTFTNANTGIVIVDNGVTMAIDNAVDGDGTLAKAGEGTLILSNANQQAGTSVRQGTLLYSADNRLRTDAGGTIAVEGGVLDLNGFNQDSAGTVSFLGGLTTNGTITKSVTDFDAQAGEVAATLQGAAGLTKTGAGTTLLSGSNAYQGATVIADGSLRLDNVNALPGGVAATGGTSALILTNGGVLGLGIEDFYRNLGTDVSNVTWTGSGGFAAYGADRHVNIGGNDSTQTLTWGQANFVSGDDELVFGAADSTHTLILDNSIEMDGTNRFRANNGSADIDGRISGNLSDKAGGVGTFWKTGDGVLELTGSNTYSGGTEVLGGQLLLSGSNALSENSLLVISNFGVITLNSTDFTRDLGTNGGDVVWAGSGGFAASGADRSVNLGGAFAQVAWGSNFFVPETVDGGVLVLGRTGTTHTVAFLNAIDLGASNRTVRAGNGDAAIDAILSGVLSGSGGLIKTGPGTLMLTNNSLFTGGLEVQEGRLILDGGDNRLQSMALLLGSTNGESGILQLGGASGKSDQTLTSLAIADAGTDNRIVGGASELSTLTLDIAAGEQNYGGFLGGPGANENNLALIKTNDGTIFLASGGTYTGRTSIVGGTLGAGGDSALGGDPGAYIADQLMLDGGTFRATNSFGTIANRGITLGAGGGVIEVDASRQLTNNAVITGTGGLTKTGGGTLQINSNSTYSGGTVVAGGVLRLNAANSVPGGIGAAGGTSGITLTNGGVIGLGGANFLRGLGAGADQIQWTGDGGFAAYNVSRSVTIANSATYQLVWGQNGFVPDGNRLILSSTDSTNQITLANYIDLGAAMRTVHVENAPVTATDGVLSGIISGAESGGLLKTGAGRLYLSNAGNTYTGRTVIAEGSILFNSEANFGKDPSVFVADQMTIDGGSLVANANGIVFDDPNRGFTFGPSNATIEVGSALTRVMTINNVIAGPGGLSKTGVGGLQLNAANTYTGLTMVSGRGFVWISNENALGAAPDSFVSNQLFLSGGSLRATNDVVIDDPNRGITISGSSTVWVDAASSLAVSNEITGTGSLTKWGAGLLSLYATNTYNNITTINEGTLALAFEEGLGLSPSSYNAARLILTNNGTLRATESFTISDPNRGIRLDANSATPSATTSGGMFDIDSGVTLNTTNRITGNGMLTKIGDGTLLLNNLTNDYRGGTVIAGGTLGIRAEQGLGTNAELYAGNLTISNGGILRALASFTIDNANKSIAIGAGGGGFEVDPTFSLTLASNIVADNLVTKYGTGRLNVYGTSNVFAGMLVSNGTVVFHDFTDDQTLINGNLVFNVDTNSQISTYHQVTRGDFSVTGDIIVNEGRLRPADTESSLFKLNATTNDFGPLGMAWSYDGLGLAERMWMGSLAQGANGVVVRDYARFEFAMPRSNMVFDVGQKITIDTQGPNYSGNERNLDFRAENLGDFTAGTMTFNVTNVWFESGAYLRINEENSVVRIGAILKGDAYLSESTSGSADDFDLLNVVSDTPGAARTLQIGTVNGVADTAFDAVLFGTGATEITFNVFNGTLTMTNGGLIEGVAQVSGSGSSFTVATGTTGSVREVQVLAGGFNNFGDVMTFSNVLVSGGAGAVLDGGQSFITNLTVVGSGSRAIFTSPNVGLDKFTIDGGEMSVVTNYTLDAVQNVTLGSNGATFRVAGGNTLIVSNVLEGVGGLAKFGPGDMLLGNTNAYGGDTLIGNGRLVLAGGQNDRLPAGTALTLGDDGTSGILQLGDSAGTSDQTLGGLQSAGSGTGNRIVGSAAGISTLTVGISGGNSNFFGGFIGGPGAGEDNIALVKSGDGTLTVAGDNTYTGTTVVAAGRLNINGDQSAADGMVSVLSGATLGGSGTVGGLTIFEAGSTNAPGMSPDIMTFAGGVTYSNGSTLLWELFANNTDVRGVDFDGIDVTGGELLIESGARMSLVFDGAGSAVDWSSGFWSSNQAWLVADIDFGLGATTNAATREFDIANVLFLDAQGDSLTSLYGGAQFWTYYDSVSGDLYLQYAVPEPSTWLLIFVGFGFVAWRKRLGHS